MREDQIGSWLCEDAGVLRHAHLPWLWPSPWAARVGEVGPVCDPSCHCTASAFAAVFASHREASMLDFVHARGTDETTRVYHSCMRCGRLPTGYAGPAAVDS